MDKIIINCPDCDTKIRIPIHLHIKFSCPNCKKNLEAMNGDLIINPDVINENSDSLNRKILKWKQKIRKFKNSVLYKISNLPAYTYTILKKNERIVYLVFVIFLCFVFFKAGSYAERSKFSKINDITNRLVTDIQNCQYNNIKVYSTKNVQNTIDLLVNSILAFGDSTAKKNLELLSKSVQPGNYSGKYLIFKDSANNIDTIEIKFIENNNDIIIDLNTSDLYK